MGNTSRYGWQFPEVGDPPNTALHLKDALEDIEATMGALDDEVNAAAIGLEARANATQAIAVGANKLTFGALSQPANGINWTSNNTATVVTAGRYALYVAASKGFIASNNFGVAVAGASAPAGGVPWISAPSFATGQTDTFTAATRWLTVGTQLCAYLYNNGPAFTLDPAVRPAEFSIWNVP